MKFALMKTTFVDFLQVGGEPGFPGSSLVQRCNFFYRNIPCFRGPVSR